MSSKTISMTYLQLAMLALVTAGMTLTDYKTAAHAELNALCGSWSDAELDQLVWSFTGYNLSTHQNHSGAANLIVDSFTSIEVRAQGNTYRVNDDLEVVAYLPWDVGAQYNWPMPDDLEAVLNEMRASPPVEEEAGYYENLLTDFKADLYEAVMDIEGSAQKTNVGPGP